VIRGAQNQMIMRSGRVAGGLDGQFAGHAKMDAQPTAWADSKKHLFAMSVGGKEGLSDHSSSSQVDRDAPEDPFFGTQMDR